MIIGNQCYQMNIGHLSCRYVCLLEYNKLFINVSFFGNLMTYAISESYILHLTMKTFADLLSCQVQPNYHQCHSPIFATFHPVLCGWINIFLFDLLVWRGCGSQVGSVYRPGSYCLLEMEEMFCLFKFLLRIVDMLGNDASWKGQSLRTGAQRHHLGT